MFFQYVEEILISDGMKSISPFIRKQTFVCGIGNIPQISKKNRNLFCISLGLHYL